MVDWVCLAIKHMMVCGLFTDQCVSSAVRDLSDWGYTVFLVEDATSAVNADLQISETRMLNQIYCKASQRRKCCRIWGRNKGCLSVSQSRNLSLPLSMVVQREGRSLRRRELMHCAPTQNGLRQRTACCQLSFRTTMILIETFRGSEEAIVSNVSREAVRMKDVEGHVTSQLGSEQRTEVYCWRTPQVAWRSPADDYTCLCSVLVPDEGSEAYLESCDRMFEIDFGKPAFDNECSSTGGFEYYRYGDCRGIEPLVIARREPVAGRMDVQIAEEFRMFHDLFLLDNSQRWYRRSGDRAVELVAAIEENSRVVVSTHRLKQYLAAKRMLLLVQFDYERFFKGIPSNEASKYHKGPVRDQSCVYEIESLPARAIDDVEWTSYLRGNKLIRGYPREKCGIEPYREAQPYPAFKTGRTETGETVVHSSDPASMNDGFIGTPTNPGPYFPVAFDRGVLASYYADHARYSVEDGMLRGNVGWVLPIDNDRRDCVAVALEHLGTMLPEAEWGTWLSHNIIGEGTLSPTSRRRWIGGDFCDPEMPDLAFLDRFTSFQADWLRSGGWSVFLDLAADDRHLLNGLHTPLAEAQEEFEAQIQALAKILPDSPNVKELKKRITRDIPEHATPIAILKMALEDTKCEACETHIEFLQLVQNLRDGVAHRKSRQDSGTYRQAVKEIGLTDSNYIEVFDTLLKRAISLLNYLARQSALLGT